MLLRRSLTRRKLVKFTNYSTFTPGLYIVGTPIGNLNDVTLRAIDVLKQAEVIACEDTRHTIKLLNHYQISTANKKLLSYTEGNELYLLKHSQNSLKAIISAIAENGQVVALCSDAGMPTVSDPGMLLIHQCYEYKLPVYCCPGPSAVTSAVSLSGFPTTRFMFEGFLPAKKQKRRETLNRVKSILLVSQSEQYSFVFFESPARIMETLQDCSSVFEDDKYLCCICSEITKKFEKVFRGSFSSVMSQLAAHHKEQVKGELTVVIGPKAELA